MTTEIIIATRNRDEKLLQTINSIDNGYIVRVMFDGVCPNYDIWDKEFMQVSYNEQQRGAVKCRNELLEKSKGNIIYATDDIIFQPNSIETAESEFEQIFPNNDGVLGFRQTGNHKFHPTGVAMVGINFLKKYPNQWLFYPKYFHFACQEILWHAVKIGKYAIGSEAITIDHLNPNVKRQYMDETHHDARKYRNADHKLMLERKKAGLIWGYNDFKI